MVDGELKDTIATVDSSLLTRKNIVEAMSYST